MAEDIHVADNPTRHRYEISAGGVLAGIAEYRDQQPGRRVFTHTEIDPPFEGRGFAGRLIGAALDDVRGRGLSAVPVCPFVVAFLRKHPEYTDVVAADARASLSAQTS